jgi:hypothetical protein
MSLKFESPPKYHKFWTKVHKSLNFNLGLTKKYKKKSFSQPCLPSGRVAQSLTQSLAKIKILLSTFRETLRFISETQREIKRNFLDTP